MIVYQEKPYTSTEVKSHLNKYVVDWFFKKFDDFSAPQKFSIVNIKNEENSLICSPTGSGKTLSAFLSVLDELVSLDLDGKLKNQVYCIYVSPLRALNNDIAKNLLKPLKEISSLIMRDTGKSLSINVQVRTGDTTPYQKQKMLRVAPHILITTPESLAIMLASIKFSKLLRDVKWFVVDEIHALCNNKRGVDLSLSMERLSEYSEYVRIGLSATVSPISNVAKYLVGKEYNKIENKFYDRKCNVVDVNYIKKSNIKVVSPVDDFINTSAGKLWHNVYKIISDYVKKNRTVLVFTNTKSATEKLVYNLKVRYPEIFEKVNENKLDVAKVDDEGLISMSKEELKDNDTSISGKGVSVDKYFYDSYSLIGAHHGSLSKDQRFDIEDRLKRGELRCVVSSTSLELGIDIGSIDVVILLGSPKSIARAMQRIGRSGHSLDVISKGVFIPTNRDDLVECSMISKMSIDKTVDGVNIPKNCLDVLSQQIYAMCVNDSLSIFDMYNLVLCSYNYFDLSYDDFISVIKYLAGGYLSLADRHVYAKIWYDEKEGTIGKRGRLARMLYMTNQGTIPDESFITVKTKRGYVGRLDEMFFERLKKGDIFVLGGDSYEFLYARGMVATVREAFNKAPSVPSWYSANLPLSFDLAINIGNFRLKVNELLEKKKSKDDVVDFVMKFLYCNKKVAVAIYDYFYMQYLSSLVPTKKRIVIEYFNDDDDNKYVIFHSLFGRRVNDVLSRAIAYVLGKINKRDIAVSINDNGFTLRSKFNLQAMRAFKHLTSENIDEIMDYALRKSEILVRRFRHCATRGFMILKSYKGVRKSVSRQQVSSKMLYSIVSKIDNDFPILKEARREVLQDLMDLSSAKLVLQGIESSKVKVVEKYTKVASPFSFELLLASISDILKMEEKQDFLKRMHMHVIANISLNKDKLGRDGEDFVFSEHSKYLDGKNFDYDKYWADEEDDKESKEDMEFERLLVDLDYACKKNEVELKIKLQLIDLLRLKYYKGSKFKYTPELKLFLDELFSGLVDKSWSDNLIYSVKKLYDEFFKN